MGRKNNFGLIWITGFSGAGKTSVARLVEPSLSKLGYNTIYLDGDDLRAIFKSNLKYTKNSRKKLGYIYFRLCSYLVAQGYVVILSANVMFDEIIEWVRTNIPRSIQVFLNVPKDVRKLRDESTKKLFLNRKMIDYEYDIPSQADIVVNNYGDNTPEMSSQKIINYFLNLHERTMDRGRTIHWDSYYKSDVAPDVPSSFCKFVCSNLKKGDHLLEIGCGNGRDAAHFLKNDMEVTAIDRSETAIKRCKKDYSNLTGKFIAGTIGDMPELSICKFDAVYARFVIHAMPLNEEILLLKECFKKLKDHGYLYIECRSNKDPLARKGKIISASERNHGHYRRFIDLKELRERLITIGYRIIYEIQKKDLAVHEKDNPVIIRITAAKS